MPTPPSGPTSRGTLGPTNGASSTSGSFTPSANSILLVYAWSDSEPCSISDSLGGSWTTIVARGPTESGTQTSAVWAYQEIGGSPASMTVTITPPSSAAHGGWVDEWTSYKVGSPTGQTAESSFAVGSADPRTLAITTLFDNSRVLGGISNWDSTTVTAGDSGTTADHSSQIAATTGGGAGHSTNPVATAGSFTLSLNRGTTERGQIIAFELRGTDDASVFAPDPRLARLLIQQGRWRPWAGSPDTAAGNATVTPAVITCTTALPQAGVGVGAAPAVLAAVTAAPQAGVGVGAAPAQVQAVAALPQPGVGVGVAPAVLAALTAFPGVQISVGVSPAVLAALTSLPGASVGVGAAPAVIPLVVTLPLVTSAGEDSSNATVTPATITALVSLPQPAVGVGITPAVLAALAALPRPGVGVGVTPAVAPLVVALPLATIAVHALAQPATIAALAALPRPAISVGVAPAVVVLLVALPLPEQLGEVTPNVNPAGPIIVGAVIVTSEALVGGTSRRGTLPGSIG
jgi:hypothetical protein